MFPRLTKTLILAAAMLALLVIAGSSQPSASAQDLPAGAAVPAEAPPAAPRKTMLSFFYDGGPLMFPIAVCSFVLLVVVFERFIALRRGRVIPGPFVKRMLQQMRDGQLDRDKALKLCEENGSPVAQVIAAAVKKWGRTSVEVEQAILDSGERITNQLRRNLRIMNGIS